MAAVVVPTAYKTLVKVVAHAFYGGDCPPKEPSTEPEGELTAAKKKKIEQGNTYGLGIVLLGALTERQWVKEDELAKDLSLHPKMVRRALRYLEQEQLVQREHRKETMRSRKKEAAALAAGAIRPLHLPAAVEDEEEEGPAKGHVISYCALDYPRLVDMLRFRMAAMQKNLKKELEGGSYIQKYRCPNEVCCKEYDSMQVFELQQAATRSYQGRGEVKLLCMVCNSEVQQIISEAGSGKTGTEADRRERLKHLRELRESLDTQLGPVKQALDSIDALKPPDFDSYAQWVTKHVVLQRHIMAAPPPPGSRLYNRPNTAATLDALGDNMQVVVDLGGPNTYTATAAGGGPARPLAALLAGGAGGSTAGGGALGAAAGGNGSGAGAGAAAGPPPKAQPPWLAPGSLAAGPSGQGANQQRPGAPMTDAQRLQAFLTQFKAQASGGTGAAAAAGSGKPLPPWLMSSFGPAAAAAAADVKGGVAGAGQGLGAGVLLSLAADLKSSGSLPASYGMEEAKEYKDVLALGVKGEEEEEEEKEHEMKQEQLAKRLKADPDAAAAAGGHHQQQHQGDTAEEDIQWEDVELVGKEHHEEGDGGQQAAAPGGAPAAAGGAVGGDADVDDVEWEDV